MTNILATILILVTTNTCALKQYLDTSYGCAVYGCTQDHSEWKDVGVYLPMRQGAKTRDNPDVRITEVIKTTTLQFEYDGKPYVVEVGKEIISKTTQKRTVTETWSGDPVFMRYATPDELTDRWRRIQKNIPYVYCENGTNDLSRRMILREDNKWYEI